MKKDRMRDVFHAPPSTEYWDAKTREGWNLIAAEWERDAGTAGTEGPWIEEVPYGMKVAGDCLHLVENAEEREALVLMLEMIVADKSFSEVAECVNNRGFRTRAGTKWTQVDIFELMPRMVDVASRIYPTDDWLERRKRIFKFAR
ncbi:MAG: hypothetical protein LAP85_27465 [Acidobacteriia bacterium]|nr:hypothetical protein [Terriglobia bacterium]